MTPRCLGCHGGCHGDGPAGYRQLYRRWQWRLHGAAGRAHCVRLRHTLRMLAVENDRIKCLGRVGETIVILTVHLGHVCTKEAVPL